MYEEINKTCKETDKMSIPIIGGYFNAEIGSEDNDGELRKSVGPWNGRVTAQGRRRLLEFCREAECRLEMNRKTYTKCPNCFLLSEGSGQPFAK